MSEYQATSRDVIKAYVNYAMSTRGVTMDGALQEFQEWLGKFVHESYLEIREVEKRYAVDTDPLSIYDDSKDLQE